MANTLEMIQANYTTILFRKTQCIEEFCPVEGGARMPEVRLYIYIYFLSQVPDGLSWNAFETISYLLAAFVCSLTFSARSFLSRHTLSILSLLVTRCIVAFISIVS